MLSKAKLPRFYERGPIEALVEGVFTTEEWKLPRFYERGPIEAAPRRVDQDAVPIELPRFCERGPIEATAA